MLQKRGSAFMDNSRYRGPLTMHVRAPGQTALLVAASIGATAVIDQLLLGGANVERADGAGTTPLLAAVQAGHASAVLALLNHGASVTHAVLLINPRAGTPGCADAR